MTLLENIDFFMEYLPTITQEESDFIEHVLSWDNDMKAAFKLAKGMFEEKDEEDGMD